MRTRALRCALAAAVLLLAAVPARAQRCAGDCNGDARLTIPELVLAVAIALGHEPLVRCAAADHDADGDVAIAELVAAVARALDGAACAPTPSPSATDGPTRTPTPTTAAAAERRVNQRTAGSQRDPDLALHPDGGVLVVWSGPAVTPQRRQLFSRRLDAAGTPLGDEVQIGAADADHDRPRLAALDGGGFAAVWEHTDRSGPTVQARVLDADGRPRGAPVAVPMRERRRQDRPAVAALAGGGFLVAWQADDSTDSGRRDDVLARAFDADGVPLADAWQVNTGGQPDWRHFEPAIARAQDGRLLIGWAYGPYGSTGRGIRVRALAADGSPVGEDLHLDTTEVIGNDGPALLAPDGGAPLTLWSRRDDGAAHARLVLRIGDVTIPFFTDQDGVQTAPALAAGEGGYAAAWQRFGADHWNVFVLRFTGPPFVPGAAFRLHDHTAGAQEAPRIALAPDGALFAVWQSFAQDGSGYGIYARVFK